MADRRATLLDLAIGASAAVLPVLLAVVLLVAAARPADAPVTVRDDRHVSVRQVAALKTFERAIVRRDRITAELPGAAALLARIPACRDAWTAREGLADRVRRWIAPTTERDAAQAARIALQLRELDDALRAFSAADRRRVSAPIGLDAEAWFGAVNAALQTPVPVPDYPEQRFTVQCADIASAVRTLARSNGRMLGSLSWRGTEVDRVIARWRPEQFVEISARDIARTNPWAGIPGCVFFAAGTTPGERTPTHYLGGVRGLDDRLCQRADVRGTAQADAETAAAVRLVGEPTPDMPVDDERWKVPPSLAAMLQPLETLHRPHGTLYRALTASEAGNAMVSLAAAAAGPAAVAVAGTDDATVARPGPNRIDIGGARVDIGYSIDVSIDPTLQALAQRVAACYTGRDDVCRAFGIVRREDSGRPLGHLLLEHALVRMAAVAVIDVESGRIEALAGAMSPCTRMEYDGPGHAAGCDKRLPYPVRYRPDALQNAAVFHDAMPGSTIKPIMAAAFLAEAGDGERLLAVERADMARSATAIPGQETLRGQLARSDSVRFLDRMFCAEKGFARCTRPQAIQTMAAAFGWDAGCAGGGDACGRRDLLFGRAVASPPDDGAARLPALDVAFGRLLAEPLDAKSASFRLRQDFALDPSKVQACAAGADGRRHTKDDWGKCRHEVVDVVSEGWGQGQARASALGVAGMMAALAAAANGQRDLHAPHLVEAVRGAAAPTSGSAAASAGTRFDFADVRANPIAPDAAEVILSGLSFSHRAGTARLACEQVFDARACAQMDWIAGKTGTPSFRNDDHSLAELARLCADGAAPSGKAPNARRDRDACAPLRPYKWYVAAFRTLPDDRRWTKAIAVLTERNWFSDSGRVHGAGDRGPNPAAEIAMQIAARRASALSGWTP